MTDLPRSERPFVYNLLHAFSLLLLSLFAVYIAIGHRCSTLARAVLWEKSIDNYEINISPR